MRHDVPRVTTENSAARHSVVDGVWTSVMGAQPYFFTAPHHVKHVRETKLHREIKKDEPGTASLALALAASLSGTAIINIADLRLPGGRYTGDPGDPNHDPTHPFKDRLTTLLGAHDTAMSIDIHGMRDAADGRERPDVIIGCGPVLDKDSAIVEAVAKALVSARFRVDVHHERGGFAGAGVNTVTSAATAAGAWAVQLEVAARVRKSPRLRELSEALTDAFGGFLSRRVG